MAKKKYIIVSFIGKTNAGKGTRIKQLEEFENLNVYHISIGSLLRKCNIDTSSGKLVDDQFVLSLLLEELEAVPEGAIIILDGFPRNLKQFHMLIEENIMPNIAVHVNVSWLTSIRRALDRLICSNKSCQATYTKSNFKHPHNNGFCDICGSQLNRRKDDKLLSTLRRLFIFETKTKPILKSHEDYKVCVVELKSNDDINKLTQLLI